jgi:hypothetical protein
MNPLDAAMMTAELLFNPLHVGAVLILSAPKDAGPDCIAGRSPRTIRLTRGFADIRIAAWTPAGCGFGARPKFLT